MPNEIEKHEFIALTADIVSAYVANNSVPAYQLAELIAKVHSSLTTLGNSEEATAPEPLMPAVPIRKSVQDEFITCLEDGKKLKSLKRHLDVQHGLTPKEYRARWDLPADYPMVAPAYAAARSALAKSVGLGRYQQKETRLGAPARKARPKKTLSAQP